MAWLLVSKNVTSKNDITGAALRTKAPNKKYAEGWDRIFGQRKRAFDETIASPPDMWYHVCKHDGGIHTNKGQACNWCGVKEDGTYD